MKTIPVRDADALTFFRLHAPVWIDNAPAIGVDPEAAEAFAAAQAAAQEAFAAAQRARAEAQAATLALRLAMADARGRAGLIIRSVRLHADATGDENVYATAQIDPVRDPVRGKPPTRPVPLGASVEPTGRIVISWRPQAAGADSSGLSASTAGVLYIVSRALGEQTEFIKVGVVAAARSGKRGITRFTDASVPAGVGKVRYRITPCRARSARSISGDGGLVGPTSNELIVSLGRDDLPAEEAIRSLNDARRAA